MVSLRVGEGGSRRRRAHPMALDMVLELLGGGEVLGEGVCWGGNSGERETE